MKLYEDDTKSINENAFVNLPAGDAVYLIAKAELRRPEGKTEVNVGMTFKNAAGESFSQPLMVQAAHDVTRRIAKETLKAIFDGAQVKGGDSEMLPNLAGKYVKLSVTHSNPDTQCRVFANIKTVHPATGFDSAPASGGYHQPDDPEDKIDMEPSTPPATAEAPAAETAKPKTKWAARKTA